MESTNNSSLNEQDIITLNLNISGMTCANCSLKINTKLNALPGVSNAQVILPTESAQVQFNKNEIDVSEILHAISDIGYKGFLSKLVIQLEPDVKIEDVDRDEWLGFIRCNCKQWHCVL